MQSCGNNMSADEMEIKRIAFFHLWGTLLRDPLQSPLTDHSSQARPSSPRKKVLPSFVRVSKFPRLGSSAKLLALETLADQDIFRIHYPGSYMLCNRGFTAPSQER